MQKEKCNDCPLYWELELNSNLHFGCSINPNKPIKENIYCKLPMIIRQIKKNSIMKEITHQVHNDMTDIFKESRM